MHVQFFIPEHHLPDKARRALWEAGVTPSLLSGGKAASAQAWLFQTWMAVRNEVDSSIVQSLPESGIVVTLSNFLPPQFRASKNQCVAAVVADFLPHPGAQIQILQNAAHAARLPGSVFIPHWPQPNLIPRDPSRGDRFETLAYFGDPQNLAPELRSETFQSELRCRCGLTLEIRGADRWHDYSDIDAVVAVRDFSKARHLHKPATKLYNAWLARVPLLTGMDSACAAEGTDGVDYLRVDSPARLLECLTRLKTDSAWRHRIVSEGQKKSATRNRDAVRQLWVDFLETHLPRRQSSWTMRGGFFSGMTNLLQRTLFFIDRLYRS